MGKIGINIATGSLQQKDIIVGIDLGTTNSLVAFIHPETKKPVALRDQDKSSLVPSVIYFDEVSGPMVGEAAKAYLISKPERTIFSAKRLMGKSYRDLGSHASFFTYKVIDDHSDSLVKVQVGDTFYSPIELSSLILKELKARAEHILKTPVSRAVITVPAYFNDAQRQATRDAGRLAGLDVLRIINEPTAASLAYGLGLNGETANAVIAVYDLGGGTFDVSILRITAGIYEVLSTNGDTFLGGDDIDKAIVDHWLEKYGWSVPEITLDKSLMQQLRMEAEHAKKTLTRQEHFETSFKGEKLQLDRPLFEKLVNPLMERTLGCCKKALADAGLKTADIDEVVLVGGSTRSPFVKQQVASFFGRPALEGVDPDEAVVLGAAIQADILAGNNKEQLLLDITPLSLGIETAGGLMDVLIPRNTRIPVRATRQYTTQTDGQSGMRISVFQGERDLVKDNRKLAEFNLTGIPGMPAGLPKVEVAFLINADGILTVSAKELRSGVSQHIEVKPQYGLTDEDVERMLIESVQFASDDMAIRALTEAKTEGELLLKTTEKFLQKNNAFINREELMATAAAMQALQLSLSMNDKNLIQSKVEALNEATRPFAQRIMEEALKSAITGTKIQ